MQSFDLLSQQTNALFQTRFEYFPELTIQAPGRVNLIGEHTDYNDGFVLPCAINYQTVITGAKRSDRLIRVIALDYQCQYDVFSLDEDILPHPEYLWANYVRGVVMYLQRWADCHQLTFNGADLVISGNIPQGAGLSSSASLEVAVGKLFQMLYHLPLTGVDLAKNAQLAENHFVGC